MMMTRFVLTLLIGLLVSLGTIVTGSVEDAFSHGGWGHNGIVSGPRIEQRKNKEPTTKIICSRSNVVDEHHFSYPNRDKWFPLTIEIDASRFERPQEKKTMLQMTTEVGFANGMRFPNGKEKTTLTYRLFASKSMQVSSRDLAGAKARYKCDKSSIEVAALFENQKKQRVTESVKPQTSIQEDNPVAEAKTTCRELGFKAGTEKHNNCVLKIGGNSGSQIVPSTSETETVSKDTKAPTITIASVNTKGKQGIVKGRVGDNTGIAEVTVDGTVIPITSSGDFEYSTFVPSGGLSLKIQATDLAGLTSMMSVTLERNAGTATAAINFDRLNPTVGKRVKTNKDALALIVGVADYENTPAQAVFADADAMMFHDYASEKLGIPESRIKTLVNDGADERELLLSVKSWLARASKQGRSDVYVFFAGHGLASDNGEKMYLLPYDGSPELLDDTAILRDRLFSDIASANPRSVTVFLDTCYSGTTRGTDMLIASRPVAIKALEQSIPDNFTVMTAARGDQTAKPLEEAKHGMFSYFLMKGMEGEADENRDNKITAGELHSYVQSNVVQQSSGSQTPELQGDKNRVLVQFQ